ncbi:MAG: YaeQ family protein [Candidatus Sedimenticola sp. (ex Thyasira tokunagai)]
MALGSTIHKAAITLSDVDRGVYCELQQTLARHPSETAERLVARLLAYALCYEEGLVFTKGICDGDAPDIWLKDQNDRIAHWIEAGLPTPERIATACKKATKVTIFLYGQHSGRWQQMHQQQLQELDRLTLIELPEELLQQAVDDLQRSINWSLTITEGQVYLTTDRQDLEGQLLRVN